MARKLLKTNDSAWLFAETHRTPMQVGMLATFRVPEDRPTFVADLVANWRECREYAPPFNLLYKTLPVPSWVELDADAIDLDYHLRHSALPAPGSQRELGILVSRLHSQKMDRRYPLWECHVIEGLEEDRWSLYLKAHHSQVDGVGGIRLLRRILSADPDARDMLPPWAIGTRGPDQSGIDAPVREPAAEIERSGPIEVVRGGVRSTAAVAGSLGRTYVESVTGLGAEENRAVPFRAPKTIFNGRIHTPRRFATQHYSIERMKLAAKAADGSLNDVFLAICGGAMRRYLIEHDALPTEDLIANVPVSVRQGHDAKVGNAVTFLYSRLGTDVSDPVDRIRAIKTSTRLGKERLPVVGSGAMDAYTAGLMAPFLGQAILGFGGRGRPASNLVISNVPGPAEPRYLDGSQMEELYPVSLLFNGQALNITGVSYAGEFNIGYTGCRDSIPSLQKIAVYSGEELGLLEEGLGDLSTEVAVLTVAVGVLAAGLLVTTGLMLAARRKASAAAERIEQLESDLSAALRPRPPATPTERAVSRVLRTVGKVREHGVAGLLQASIEDLQTWAQEERADIVSMAAADGTVTLFFSDIEDSTALNHRLGDEGWVKLLAAHDQLLRSRIDKYRGQVVKTAGDGFMVAFRDPEAACRAALGIQKDLGRTMDQRLRQVRVRIGIHTGTVVSRDGDYFGRNVAIAARIGDLASGGEVLATSAVLDALEPDAAVELEEAGEAELKGLPGTHVFYRVRRKT